MLADFPEVDNTKEVDHCLLNIPKRSNISLGLLRHHLHKKDISDTRTYRVEEAKSKPETDHENKITR